MKARNWDQLIGSSLTASKKWGPIYLVPINCEQEIGTNLSGPHQLPARNWDQLIGSPLSACKTWEPTYRVPVNCEQEIGTNLLEPGPIAEKKMWKFWKCIVILEFFCKFDKQTP